MKRGRGEEKSEETQTEQMWKGLQTSIWYESYAKNYTVLVAMKMSCLDPL